MVMHYSFPLNNTSSDNFWKVIAPQPLLINTDNVKTPNLMLKMKLFWLIFHGQFEQKTQQMDLTSLTVEKRTDRKQKFSKIKFLKNTFYKIVFSPTLEGLLQNFDFLHFSSCLLKCLPMCPSINSFCHKVDRKQEELINQTLSIFASVIHASKIGKPLSRDQRSRRHVQKGWRPI